MEALIGGASNEIPKKTFLNHVFSTTEEGKAEVMNVIQYSVLGVIPIVVLNKIVQKFIPDADHDKSSLEILAEILLQIIVMFCGIILIHRVITYVPTYSGFKYDNFVLTNTVLAFLIIVLSIQTKLGIKVNILADRVFELWSGPTSENKNNVRRSVRVSGHSPSQADYLDSSAVQSTVFPPAPVANTRGSGNTYDTMMRGGGEDSYMGPMAANSVLGGSFASAF